MENPFEYIDPYKHYLTAEDVVENNQYDAWNEGGASRDAEVSEHHVVIKNLRAALVAEHKKLTEQAEIVSELVDVCQQMLGMITTEWNGPIQEKAKAAIAKGE